MGLAVQVLVVFGRAAVDAGCHFTSKQTLVQPFWAAPVFVCCTQHVTIRTKCGLYVCCYKTVQHASVVLAVCAPVQAMLAAAQSVTIDPPVAKSWCRLGDAYRDLGR